MRKRGPMRSFCAPAVQPFHPLRRPCPATRLRGAPLWQLSMRIPVCVARRAAPLARSVPSLFRLCPRHPFARVALASSVPSSVSSFLSSSFRLCPRLPFAPYGPVILRFAAVCAAFVRSEATKRRKDGISRLLRLFSSNRAYKVMLSGKNGLPLPNPCLDRLRHGIIRASGLHYLCRV